MTVNGDRRQIRSALVKHLVFLFILPRPASFGGGSMIDTGAPKDAAGVGVSAGAQSTARAAWGRVEPFSSLGRAAVLVRRGVALRCNILTTTPPGRPSLLFLWLLARNARADHKDERVAHTRGLCRQSIPCNLCFHAK